MPATAHFASARAELVVIEQSSNPIYEGGREVGTKPGRYHRFVNHRCKIEGQKAIDFMRDRMKAPDGPEIWELDATDVPPVNALLAEMATADVARVREILRAESDGPSRSEVIDVAKKVLDRAGASERPSGGQTTGRARHEAAV